MPIYMGNFVWSGVWTGLYAEVEFCGVCGCACGLDYVEMVPHQAVDRAGGIFLRAVACGRPLVYFEWDAFVFTDFEVEFFKRVW